MQRRLLTVISDASACPAPPQGADHRLRVVVHATDRSGCWLSKRSSVDPVRFLHLHFIEAKLCGQAQPTAQCQASA
jgi:hypothetical protein